MTVLGVVDTFTVRCALALVSGLAAMMLVRRTSHLPGPGGTRDVAVLLATGITAWSIGPVELQPTSIVILPLLVIGQAAAVVDIREQRLPDPLTLALLPLTLVATFVAGAHPVGLFVAAATAGAAALILKAWSSAAIGWGDVKLAPTLGVVLAQFDAVAAGLWNITLLVLATAVLVTVDRSRGDGVIVPYGPALVLGTLGATVGR